MGTVIGDILPFALGIAISPIPIIVVILTLLSPRARSAGVGFMIGWTVGILVVVSVLSALATILPTSQSATGPHVVEGVIKLVLGGLLVLLAVQQWRKRPRGDEPAALPGWMARIDSFGFGGALRFGLFLSLLNPKNIILSASVGMDIGSSDMPLDGMVIVVAAFVLLASSTVIVPVLAYLVASDRLQRPLQGLHTWLARENHTIMAVLLLVLGVNAIGRGVGVIWP